MTEQLTLTNHEPDLILAISLCVTLRLAVSAQLSEGLLV